MARPLKIFMRGKSVRTLQEMLKRLGYSINDQPSIFGTTTRDAVKNFQSQQGLQSTGIVDDELLNLMRQGHNISDIEASTTPKTAQKTTPVSQPVYQEKLDALIRLLIATGIISESELLAEIKRTPPKRATRLPLE